MTEFATLKKSKIKVKHFLKMMHMSGDEPAQADQVQCLTIGSVKADFRLTFKVLFKISKCCLLAMRTANMLPLG